MKRLCMLFFFIWMGTAWTQWSTKIHEDLNRGVITQEEALFLEVVKAFSPQDLPLDYQGEPVTGHFPLALSYKMRQSLNTFSGRRWKSMKTMLARPALPHSIVSESGRFKIHYTLEGYHAVSPDDLDGSGIPDYVETAATVLDSVYHVEIEQLNLLPPPSDADNANNGGGPEIDVYIRSIGYYGITHFDEKLSSNPDIWTVYMSLDNNYTHTATKGLAGLRVTAAHEFFHVIQLGYAYRDDDVFILEAGATWMEDVVYDHINDYYYYLDNFFSQTNVSFTHTGMNHEYGLCLWFHFVEETLGDAGFISSLWSYMPSHDALNALDRYLRTRGLLFDEELAQFYGWNAAPADFYPEGAAYPEYTVSNLDTVVYFSGDFTYTKSMNPLAARYIRVIDTDGSEVTLIPVSLYRETVVGEDLPNFTVAVVSGEARKNFIPLTDRLHARLVADDELKWNGSAVVRQNGETRLVAFNGSPSQITQDNLPAALPSPFIISQHSLMAIPYILDEAGDIQVVISSASGHRILTDRFWKESGRQYFNWNGKDQNGETVASGVYVYAIFLDGELIRHEKVAVIR